MHPDFFCPLKADHVFPHDRFLDWIFLRFFPKFVTPNQITLFRIFATPFVFVLTLFEHYQIGIIAFILVAFTDALDGSMARTRDQITEFGKIFDPLADKLLICSMVLILVFRYLPPWLGFAILGIEILFIISATVATTRFRTVKAANRWGKIKMMLQVVAVGFTLMALLLEFPYLLTVAAWIFGVSIGFALISLFSQGI